MIETKFKQTELGPIPEDWEVGTFVNFLTTFSAGATPYRGIPDNFIGQIPWISSGELNYCEINDTREHISLDAQRNTHLTVHKPGTFLIAITGLEAAGTRGRCAFVKTPSTTNQSCLAINSTDKMTVKYLFWFYRQWSDYLAFNFSQGSKQQSFTAEIAKKLPIYAPTYNEQVAIAEALNDADALILELDTLIEKKKAVLQGAMQELLTGRRRLSGFSSPWKTRPITDICSIKARIGWQGLRSDEFLNSGDYVLVTGTDILQGHVNWSHTYFVSIERFDQDKSIQLKLGDILITKDGTIGKVAFIDKLPKPATLNSGIYVIRPKQGQSIFNGYLSWFFKSSFFDDFIQELRAGSTISHLYQKDFVKLNIFSPSDTAEQRAIAAILSDMDAEIAELDAKREKYASIRHGMMQQLLTGKIRLI